MKRTTKTLTILSVLLTVSLTLVGQKTLLIQDMQPLMAFGSDTKYDMELSAERISSSYQFYMEDKMQLKDWMINSSHWVAAENQEEDITMEDWMLHTFARGGDWITDLLKEEKEVPLQLHDWMICCTDWKIVRL